MVERRGRKYEHCLGKMLKLINGSSKKVRRLQKTTTKKKIKERGVYACTFVYRSTSHVVETQSRVHVIHVLQKREKILHFFKRDPLINTTDTSER